MAVYESESNVSKHINVVAQELNLSQGLVLETSIGFKNVLPLFHHTIKAPD